MVLATASTEESKTFFFNNVTSFGYIGKVENMLGSSHTSAEDLDLSHLDRQLMKYFHTNFHLPTILSSFMLRKHKNKRAGSKEQLRIVNTSSLAAIEPFPTWSGYCCAKASMDMFLKVLAVENSKTSTFKCLNYAPGPMATKLHSEMLSHENLSEDVRKLHNQMIKEGNMVKPMDSAAKCIQLLLDDNYESGQHIDYFDY
mmetsp:Transcript_7403/g.8504  ORF Transcript_7403/g.8504 Transcript_7403/m.8504 type:complete len:200 (+) Transcript_7403:432-1031(+)